MKDGAVNFLNREVSNLVTTMAEVVEKKVTASEGVPGAVATTTKAETYVKGATPVNFVYYILGILEILLGFRLILKLLGANPGSAFVSIVYAVSRPFVILFEGIFSRVTTEGAETTSVLEPSTLVAMLVYAILAWIIAKFIEIATRQTD